MAKDLEKEEVALNQVAETMGELKSKIKSSAKAKKEAKEALEENVVEEVVEPVEETKTPKFKYEQPEFMKKLLDPENKDNIEFFNEDVSLSNGCFFLSRRGLQGKEPEVFRRFKSNDSLKIETAAFPACTSKFQTFT